MRRLSGSAEPQKRENGDETETPGAARRGELVTRTRIGFLRERSPQATRFHYNRGMYIAVLTTHSWLRWVVVLLGVIVIVRALAGARAKRPWNAADARASRLFGIALDLQFLLGLVLYLALSPITRAAMQDFGEAMRVSAMRYWAVEHVFGMVVGLAFAHAGQARVRKTADPVGKHRVAAVFFILAFIAIAASIPWPGTPNARPLWRW